MTDARQYAPATARNRTPILEVLHRTLPRQGKVLELAAGSGEHAVFFASHFPGLNWRPSDPDASARASIAAWIAAEGARTIGAPVDIDVRARAWGVEADAPFDAMLAINMIHIAPWDSTLGLMAGAARLLRAGGVLYLYGPYRRDGAHTAASNAAFDASLKARNGEWGVRDLEAVIEAAAQQGLVHHETVQMPANNLSLIFMREGRGGN